MSLRTIGNNVPRKKEDDTFSGPWWSMSQNVNVFDGTKINWETNILFFLSFFDIIL